MILDVPATTDDTKLVVDRLNQIAEDAAKPKSLAEIYALVGSFPFKAKAAVSCGDSAEIPTGMVIKCMGQCSVHRDAYLTDYYRYGKQSSVVGSIRRWLLMEA